MRAGRASDAGGSWRAGAALLAAVLWCGASGADPEPARATVARAGTEAPAQALFGLGAFRSDQPISIRSDELEATQKGGARRLDFRGHVQVVQANLELRSERLQAFYRGGQSQPERLVADGQVRVAQGENRARCDHATYDVAGERLLCRGNARVVDGLNTVSGEEIDFDLARETLVVTGGARLLIQPASEPGPAAGSPPPAADAPDPAP